MGINALRETFREADVVRVHPIITKGGDLVNSVPADVRIETYVRAKTMEAIEATHKKVDTALKAGGDAVGAQTVIATMPGQLPLACNNRLNELFVTVSLLVPVIHPFIGGVDGFLHTADFHVVDFKHAVLLPAKAFAMMIIDLLADDAELARQIKAEHHPLLTKEEYIAKLDKYFQ